MLDLPAKQKKTAAGFCSGSKGIATTNPSYVLEDAVPSC